MKRAQNNLEDVDLHLSHLRVQFCLLGLALALITTSCSKSNLNSKPIKASSPAVSVPTSEAPKNQTEDQDTAAKTEASPAIVNKVDDAQNGKKSAVVELPSNVDQNGNLNACPSANQTILILDLKSGWWAGDGGSFVNKIVNSGLALPCQGKVSIEYHHLTGNGFGENSVNDQYLMAPSSPVLMQQVASFEQIFKDPTWNSYQEIWLLSGSAADHADLPVASPFFQKLVQKISASKASLFIAAGFGSISHASAISTALGIGANFSTPHPEGMILNPMMGVGLINSVSGSLMDTQHILLKGGIQSLADKVRVGPIVTYGDVIVDKGGLEIVAKDNTGAISLAVLKDKSRKVVLDANLPRYYAAWSDDQSPDTMKVLKNILVYLAQ